MKKLVAAAAVVLLASTATPAIAADLIGVQVTGTLLYPDQNTNYNGQTSVTKTVIDPGVEFAPGFFGAPGSIDVGANSVTFNTNYTGAYGSGAYNGYRLDFGGRKVTSFTLDESSTYKPHGLSVSGSSVFFDVTGVPANGGRAVFDVQTAAVPEPATWAMTLMGFGMVGFGLRARRNGKVSTRIAYA